MLWTSGPETQTIYGIEYRNVWLKDDPEAARGAKALGALVTPPGRKLPPDYWASNLCVVAFEKEEVIALAPGEIRYAGAVRANMAFLRVYVAPTHRQRGVVIPLTIKFYEVMRKYSLDNPDKRIGGIMAVVTVPGIMDEPIGKAFLIVMGYNERGQPLIIRWFDHFRF
ncbi:MAG: hypothetical protein JOZ55_04620 [Alphaproteobacteria bacterium]|nr:hypothetical protein [Alphaproteobacteria bacterium]